MHKYPLVSVGIPTYNQADVIELAIQSALDQDYPNLEVIVADDNSPDNTKEVVEKFRSDPRFRYVLNEPNIGRVANYRKLLYEYSQSEWHINLDGDDCFSNPNFISKAIGYTQTFDDVVIVSFGCQRTVKGENDYIIRSQYGNEPKQIDGLQFFKDIPSEKAWFSHLTTLYNRPRAMALDFYREDILSADYESLYRLVLTGNIVCTPEIAGIWKIHGENASATKFFDIPAILKNFRYIENAAKFASSYLTNAEVRQWRKKKITGVIESYVLAALMMKGVNKFGIIKSLFTKYPGMFIAAMSNIVGRQVKKRFGKHGTS